jgi:hypothetical protein
MTLVRQQRRFETRERNKAAAADLAARTRAKRRIDAMRNPFGNSARSFIKGFFSFFLFPFSSLWQVARDANEWMPNVERESSAILMRLAVTELRIMIRTLAICSTVALGACAVWPVGKDPRGRALIEKANPVLVAADGFKRSHGTNPENLDALVPDFIGALPSEPKLTYDAKKGLLRFT